MSISIFLAKMLGVIFILMPIIVWFDESKTKSLVKIVEKKSFFLSFGTLVIIFSSAIISSHNLWILSWELVITLIGWLFLIIGIFSFISPSTTSKILSFILKERLLLRALLLIIFIIGLYLFRISLIK